MQVKQRGLGSEKAWVEKRISPLRRQMRRPFDCAQGRNDDPFLVQKESSSS
jgi:hypothetical protein